MAGHKFDFAKLDKLRDPDRLRSQDPERIWSLIAAKAPRVVVDIGAGIGFFALPFARAMPEGKVYAADIEPKMLDALRGILREEGVDNIEALSCEEAHVPLPDGCADVVFMANLHHEFDHPLTSLRDALRLLRVGGSLAIFDWDVVDSEKGPPLHVRVAPDEVTTQLNEVGFTEVARHDGFPYHYLITATKA